MEEVFRFFRDGLTGNFGPKKCCFNMKYDDDYYSLGESAGRREVIEDIKKRISVGDYSLVNELLKNDSDVSDDKPFFGFDIPKQNAMNKKSHLCGYVEIDGTYHKCNSCEHETVIRRIIWENEEFREMYFREPSSFFDSKPIGMLQEEYFAMKRLGFVKISSFKDTPTDMIVFFYNNLTYKQADIVYPR